MESTTNNYIMGNCLPLDLNDIKDSHVIPVHTKDNSALISQAQFIDVTKDLIRDIGYKSVSLPDIRVSHPIKGRIPDAIHKSTMDLLPHEETLYYERMIFLYKINDVQQLINGNNLSLIIGGVKAYNLDNFNKDHSGMQNFKVFIGFQVQVCSNLCVWSDGSVIDIKVNNIDSLSFEINKLISDYSVKTTADSISRINDYYIDENQFAHLIGRCRMYHHLPISDRLDIIDLEITDTQINNVVKHYYHDNHFGVESGKIDMWSLYNLFTHATKNSYIDKYVDRNKNASILIQDLVEHIEGTNRSFFLN